MSGDDFMGHPRVAYATHFLLLTVLSLTAVSPAAAQVIGCPEPYHTVEMLKERITRLAASERARDVGGLVSRAFAPDPPEVCGVLRHDVDIPEAVDELVRFVALRGDPSLDGHFFGGLGDVLLVAQRGAGRSMPVPMGAIRFAVEQTESTGVITLLRRMADQPQIRAYLLTLLRAERGPGSRANLPEVLVEVFVRFPTPKEEALLAELRTNPSLVRNARARCLVERGWGPDHGPPNCPPG